MAFRRSGTQAEAGYYFDWRGMPPKVAAGAAGGEAGLRSGIGSSVAAPWGDEPPEGGGAGVAGLEAGALSSTFAGGIEVWISPTSPLA